MLKEPPGFATCFRKMRHKSLDNPATKVDAFEDSPQPQHGVINKRTKKRYTSRHV